MDKYCYVYILSNHSNTTLYTGCTQSLSRRVYEHKNQFVSGFTKKYHVNKLVYWEQHLDLQEALAREKRIKRWHREWKNALIEGNNPTWKDLYCEILGE